MTSAQGGQHAADHNRGVPLGGQEDVGAHGGGSGFAMGTCHAQGVLIVAHNGAPGLGPLEDGNPGGPGGGDLGVVVVDGGGTDDTVGTLHALRQVADDHRDAQRAQMGHGSALVEIGAGNVYPCAVEHLAQRGHGYPADAHQMGALTGADIIMDIRVHRETPQKTQISARKFHAGANAQIL